MLTINSSSDFISSHVRTKFMLKISVFVAWFSAAFFSVAVFAFPIVPDQGKTPGTECTRNDPDFAEFRYREKIPYCQRNVSEYTKDKIYKLYGIDQRCKNRYTIDHFIPLSLGGNNAETNLWPEHKLIKQTRADLELKLFQQLSNGTITQQQAIDTIYREKLHPRYPPTSTWTHSRINTPSSNPCDQAQLIFFKI